MSKISPISHNLNIKIFNENDELIENKSLLESIYNELVDKPIIKKIHAYGTDLEIKLLYTRKSITKIEKKFMGDIFIVSLYSDNILYDATKFVLNEIEHKLKLETETIDKNWKIVFHISKLLENINKNILNIKK
jgi:hypothetical protein